MNGCGVRCRERILNLDCHVACAEVSDEGALRMRRTPCGCVPCDSPIENALYGAITGYAARILPVDFSQPPVETDFFAL